MNTDRQGECTLCGQVAELQTSHILPAFVYRWLKSDSLTGHMRFSQTPNRRAQDGIKKKMLCAGCENRIGAFEKKFCEQLFRPVLLSGQQVRYSKYLLLFATSISWRVAKHCYGQNPKAQYSHEQKVLLKKAEDAWRLVLLDESPHPGEFEQHLLYFGKLSSSNAPNLPKNINRFFRSSIMLDIVGAQSSLFTFAKLGPFMIFGHIQGSKANWRGTKIHVNSGIFPPSNVVLPKSLWPLFLEKAQLQSDFAEHISDTQFFQIQGDIERNIEHVGESGAIAAALADAGLFGDAAIIRERRRK